MKISRNIILILLLKFALCEKSNKILIQGFVKRIVTLKKFGLIFNSYQPWASNADFPYVFRQKSWLTGLQLRTQTLIGDCS
jgi:hypothetical protein